MTWYSSPSTALCMIRLSLDLSQNCRFVSSSPSCFCHSLSLLSINHCTKIFASDYSSKADLRQLPRMCFLLSLQVNLSQLNCPIWPRLRATVRKPWCGLFSRNESTSPSTIPTAQCPEAGGGWPQSREEGVGSERIPGIDLVAVIPWERRKSLCRWEYSPGPAYFIWSPNLLGHTNHSRCFKDK